MSQVFIPPVHGAFAISFRDDYTLISVAEPWNENCAEIYEKLLDKRIDTQPSLRRCVLIDGRRWGLETPESDESLIALAKKLSEYYQSLHVAYILNPDCRHLTRIILEKNIRDFKEVLHWEYFEELTHAVRWLRRSGFDLPEISWEDFPAPIHAEKYAGAL